VDDVDEFFGIANDLWGFGEELWCGYWATRVPVVGSREPCWRGQERLGVLETELHPRVQGHQARAHAMKLVIAAVSGR